MGWLSVTCAALFALTFGPATAAEILVGEIPGEDFNFIRIRGEITAGDADRFFDSVSNLERVTVILESPGGVLREALQIGAEIRTRNLATMVLPDTGCYSACGLIWVSGSRRYMSPTSQIGFHAVFSIENGEFQESGVGNAEVGSFLTHLGLRIEAIRFFTIAGPNEFLLLTPERARALGIDVYEQNGIAVTTPDQNPVIDVYVDRFVAFAFLQSRCLAFFQAQSSALESGSKTAFEKGNQLVGGEQWVNLMTQRLEGLKQEIDSKGALLHCVAVEADLRRQSLSTGIDGPSFDCSKAASDTERTICGDEDLWPKDLALSSIYFYIRKHSDKATRERLLAIQRNWLGIRNDCGTSRACLNEVYDERLRDLREIEIPSQT